jgi:hypothetical protein
LTSLCLFPLFRETLKVSANGEIFSDGYRWIAVKTWRLEFASMWSKTTVEMNSSSNASLLSIRKLSFDLFRLVYREEGCNEVRWSHIYMSAMITQWYEVDYARNTLSSKIMPLIPIPRFSQPIASEPLIDRNETSSIINKCNSDRAGNPIDSECPLSIELVIKRITLTQRERNHRSFSTTISNRWETTYDRHWESATSIEKVDYSNTFIHSKMDQIAIIRSALWLKITLTIKYPKVSLTDHLTSRSAGESKHSKKCHRAPLSLVSRSPQKDSG